MNPPVFFWIIISVERSFVEMPGLPQLWKSFQDSHNCLENSSSFPQSFGKAKKQLFHIPTKPEIFKCRL
jgi:hypothetical protein